MPNPELDSAGAAAQVNDYDVLKGEYMPDPDFYTWWNKYRLAHHFIFETDIALAGWHAAKDNAAPAPRPSEADVAELVSWCKRLLDYRRRAGAIGFQLEKADDYMRGIGIALENFEPKP